MRRWLFVLFACGLGLSAKVWADTGWAICVSSDTALKWTGTAPTCASSTGTVCPNGDYLWIVNQTTDTLEDCRIAGLTEADTLNTVCGRASGCEISNPTLTNWFQVGADAGEKEVWYLDGGTFYQRRLNGVNAPTGRTKTVETGTTETLAYGTVTSPTSCETLTGAGVQAYANACKPMKTIFFPAIALETDGTNCGSHTKVAMNSGPLQSMFSCADSSSSVFYASLSMLRTGWDGGPIQVTLHVYHATTETIWFEGKMVAQCRAPTEVVDNTWSADTQLSVAITTAHRIARATTAAITPNGTCAPGDDLHLRFTVDPAAFSTNAVNARVFGLSLHYSQAHRSGLDE